MKRSVVWALTACLAGILLEPFCQVPVVFLISLLIAVISFGLHETARKRPNKGPVYFLIAFLLFGLLNSQWQGELNQGNIAFLNHQKVALIGTVCEEPVLKGDKINYTLQVEEEKLQGPYKEPLQGKVLVTVNKPSLRYAYGDRLEVEGTPEIPDESGNPGEFSYKKYLEQQGIQLVLNKWQETGIEKIGTGRINPFVNFCLKIKNILRTILYKTIPQAYAGIMEGILFGTMGNIDPQAKDDFAVSGVIHIFSVSGYHVGILVLVFSGLAEYTGLKQFGRTLLILAITLFYAVMTGATPPVMRATLMAWIMLLSKYTEQDCDWVTSLCATALLLLLYHPFSLYNAGFQLSFVATWGLFYLIPVIHKILPPTVFLRDALSVTMAAQIAVLPITSYYFNYFSLVSIPANLLIVPLISIIMLLGGIALFGGLIWLPFAGIVHVSAGFLIEFIIRIAHALAGLPFATLDVRQPSLPQIALFYTGLFALVELVQKEKLRLKLRRFWFLYKRSIVTAVMVLSAAFIWVSLFFTSEDRFEVVFLSIGQGDCALIRSPGGKHILIDTGGAYKGSNGAAVFDPGEKILLPYLIREGIDEIDLMILTHPHLDHYGGAEALIGKIKVEQIMTGLEFTEDPDAARVLEGFIDEGSEIQEIQGGETIVFDETIVLEMLNTASAKRTNVNDESLVTRVGYGAFHLMFTGDAETVVLDELAPGLKGVEADVIKVPHHGSANAWSDAFYDAVKPDVAVISVGAHNNFGHPAREILNNLNQKGITILRTDQQGAITFTSDGKSYEYKTGKEMSQLGF